ncbi:phage antirepressor N-terminal domain-containing protein [Parabacteroides johnsonii]|uniref:phage antirepressor N-terminal domain-containing protein n=1 Tax=Parabacteroides johnsonii TaxID=387661 RepID=UPI0011DD997B|nr:phage antirepressor N-terminal domain-containing protein [Parabacteroides johnsonii]
MTNLALNTREIAKVNNVAIVASNDPKKLVPIKPICEALGIDIESQRKKIKEHPILSSTAVLSTVVASDGKAREMYCIPFEFVFGWLFTINPANVKEESRDGLIKYQQECYHVLYEYFASYASFVNQKQKRQAEDWARIQILKKEFHEAKNKLAKATKQMNMTVDYSFEQWKANGKQLLIEFE